MLSRIAFRLRLLLASFTVHRAPTYQNLATIITRMPGHSRTSKKWRGSKMKALNRSLPRADPARWARPKPARLRDQPIFAFTQEIDVAALRDAVPA